LSKPPPPLLGFNNNVRHRGRVFHIQTEDSGVTRARLVTHLFADGGRIVRTSRTDYSEYVGREDMVPLVRRLMKEQHKAMFIVLRSGELDDDIEAACGAHPQPARPLPRAQGAKPATPAPPAAEALPDAPTEAEPEEPVALDLPQPPSRELSNPALHKVVPSVPPPTGDLELDVDSLDLHPPGAFTPPDPRRAAALARTRPPPAPTRPTSAEQPDEAFDEQPGDQPGRYAASRPAAIFADLPSPKNSIFGQDMVSEQSLDEVILSYLADDLEGPSSE
jgi:hypothetical protein